MVGIVPFFGDFLSLVGALINPIFTNILPGFMLIFYIIMRPNRVIEGDATAIQPQMACMDWLLKPLSSSNRGWKANTAVCVGWFMILSGAFIIVGGTYSTIVTIKLAYDEGTVGSTFSCTDNSI
jgi:hypothetical protein